MSDNPYQKPPGLIEGERRKDAALSLLAARRETPVIRGRRALLRKAIEVGWATADDVRRAVELPEGVNPKCFGAVPGPLAKAGIIVAEDRVRKSARPAAHARPLTVWRLRDHTAAILWLESHPDAPPQSDA